MNSATDIQANIETWLQAQPYILLAIEDAALIITGPNGVQQSVGINNFGLVWRWLEAITTSKTEAWAYDATQLHIALKQRAGVQQRGLKSAQVAMMTLWPERGQSAKALPAMTVPETLAMIEKIKAELQRKPQLRKWVRLDQATDALWREPAERGYLVDAKALEHHKREVQAARELSRSYFGRDLLHDEAALEWMHKNRVVCNDQDGRPTCGDLWRADVPRELLGADWPIFVEVRAATWVHGVIANIETHLHADGRVYPRINANAAATGRMSVTQPAIQNTPRDAREIFRAEQGRVLVGCDLSQVDPRVCAVVSQDPGLLAAVQEGDVYEELAVQIWGEAVRGKEDRRALAKVAVNATNYGQGSRSLAYRLGCTREEAAQVMWAWSHAYPRFESWKRELVAASEGGQQITTFGGRPLPLLDKHYQAVAYVVQGSAADIFKAMVRNVARELLQEKSPIELWLPIHDELILSVPDDPEHIAQALDILRRHMRSEINGVAVAGEPQVVGRSWRKV